MFAVVRTGGKQYRVSEGDVMIVEKLDGNVGESISFNEVLAVGGDAAAIGTPLVSGASVTATILEQGKGEKVIVFKKTRRQTYRRKRGHRQEQTVLRVTAVAGVGGAKVAAAPKKAKPAPKAKVATEKKEPKAAAAKKPAAKKPAAKSAAKPKASKE